jgi:hypothetical protein
MPVVAGVLILMVACMWMIPDRRIEKKLHAE